MGVSTKGNHDYTVLHYANLQTTYSKRQAFVKVTIRQMNDNFNAIHTISCIFRLPHWPLHCGTRCCTFNEFAGRG